MSREQEEEFERWFARNHPWDWFKAELGKPLPSMARLCIWELCRDAYLRQERSPVRAAHLNILDHD